MQSILLVKKLFGLVEMMSRLVNASFSLPKWQAVKINDFLCTLIRDLKIEVFKDHFLAKIVVSCSIQINKLLNMA